MVVKIIDVPVWGSPPASVVSKLSREEKWFCKTSVSLSGSSALASQSDLAFQGELWHDGDGIAIVAEISTWWPWIGVVTGALASPSDLAFRGEVWHNRDGTTWWRSSRRGFH